MVPVLSSSHPEIASRATPPACVGVKDEAHPRQTVDPGIFRDGLFALRTRRFGKIGELLIERLTGAGLAKNIFHDLFDHDQGKRIEVKFATVSAKHEMPITAENMFDAVASVAKTRALSFCDWRNTKFDCNIQQIKPAEFDILFYGLFFHDRVSIFKIEPVDILSDRLVRFCDRQHKGNVGEGQFHLNQSTLEHHLRHYHVRDLSYTEFIELFSSS